MDICMLCVHSAGYKGSSDLYIDANIQLALAAGRRVRGGASSACAGAAAHCVERLHWPCPCCWYMRNRTEGPGMYHVSSLQPAQRVVCSNVAAGGWLGSWQQPACPQAHTHAHKLNLLPPKMTLPPLATRRYMRPRASGCTCWCPTSQSIGGLTKCEHAAWLCATEGRDAAGAAELRAAQLTPPPSWVGATFSPQPAARSALELLLRRALPAAAAAPPFAHPCP